jgi:hypothetical protein
VKFAHEEDSEAEEKNKICILELELHVELRIGLCNARLRNDFVFGLVCKNFEVESLD